MRKVDSDSFLLCRRVASTEMGSDAAFQSQKQNGSQLALHASSCQEQFYLWQAARIPHGNEESV